MSGTYAKKNYYDYGINAFWLDNSEPDYGVYDFDHYRYIEGTSALLQQHLSAVYKPCLP